MGKNAQMSLRKNQLNISDQALNDLPRTTPQHR